MLIRPRVLARLKEIVAVFIEYGFEDIVDRSGVHRYIARVSIRGSEMVRRRALETTGARLRAALERLGPTFIKLGQVLSTQAGLLPVEYLTEIELLQDSVSTRLEVEQVRSIIEQELGAKVEELFSRFDWEPIAAGSIAQVHRAYLKDGRAVVVKVLRPEVIPIVEIDLEILSDVAEFLTAHSHLAAKYDFRAIVEQLEHAIFDELNFRLEARHAMMLKQNIADFKLIYIPEIFQQYTTRQVLVAEYVEGVKALHLSEEIKSKIDGERLSREVLEAYLKQVFVDGLFHCDPHPGNVLIMPDGRVALIDFGQMARLSMHMQDGLMQLLLNITANRGDRVADICISIGAPRDGLREDKLRRDVSAIVARYHNLPLEELEVGRSVFQIIQACADNGLQIPGEIALLGKAMVNLDAVGRAVNPDFNPFDTIRGYAEKIVLQQIKSGINKESLVSSTLDLKRLIADLPYQLRQIFGRLSADRLRLEMHLEGHERMIDAFRKIANRIALSVIAAALIIGSSNLFAVDAGPKIWGYPLFALLGFLAAAGLGVHLVIGILFRDSD